LATKATKFGEITQHNGRYVVQGHSNSPILVPIDLLLVIKANLPPILHRFQVMADYVKFSLATEESLHFNALAGCDSLRISNK